MTTSQLLFSLFASTKWYHEERYQLIPRQKTVLTKEDVLDLAPQWLTCFSKTAHKLHYDFVGTHDSFFIFKTDYKREPIYISYRTEQIVITTPDFELCIDYTNDKFESVMVDPNSGDEFSYGWEEDYRASCNRLYRAVQDKRAIWDLMFI